MTVFWIALDGSAAAVHCFPLKREIKTQDLQGRLFRWTRGTMVLPGNFTGFSLSCAHPREFRNVKTNHISCSLWLFEIANKLPSLPSPVFFPLCATNAAVKVTWSTLRPAWSNTYLADSFVRMRFQWLHSLQRLSRGSKSIGCARLLKAINESGKNCDRKGPAGENCLCNWKCLFWTGWGGTVKKLHYTSSPIID